MPKLNVHKLVTASEELTPYANDVAVYTASPQLTNKSLTQKMLLERFVQCGIDAAEIGTPKDRNPWRHLGELTPLGRASLMAWDIGWEAGRVAFDLNGRARL